MPTPFRLHTDPWGRAVLTDEEGSEHVGVELTRAFPISDPRGAVSVLDAHGREVLWIDSLDALPPEPRRQVEQLLALREFLPVIRRVVHISTRVEPPEWQVDTDRGPTSFRVTSDGDVRPLPDRRALVTSSEGIRYLIPDLASLDPASRHMLERYL